MKALCPTTAEFSHLMGELASWTGAASIGEGGRGKGGDESEGELEETSRIEGLESAERMAGSAAHFPSLTLANTHTHTQQKQTRSHHARVQAGL